MSEKTDLYRHFDVEGNLLYVGISLNASARYQGHKSVSAWAKDVKTIKIETFGTRKEAEDAEAAAILTEGPRYNKQGRKQPKKTHPEMQWEEGESSEVRNKIKRIDDWLKATGMKEYRLGLLACANNYAVSRIRTGKGSVESLRQVLRYIDENPAT